MTRRIRDERGSAMITALIATILMLGLGLALLAIVDTQADQSAQERTRDRGFNLSESVLTSEAFVLGRSWPNTAPVPNPACGADGAGFDDGIRAITPATSPAAARLRNNLDASYTDAAYNGATWQVNICDDVDGSTVWDDSLLNNKTWDANVMPDGTTGNNKVWVRARSTVENRTRVVVGLVQVRQISAFDPRFGLASGNLSQDLYSTIGVVTNASVAGGVIGNLLNASPQVSADPNPAFAPPKSGVTGLRCGLLDHIGAAKTCIVGALAAASSIPLVDNLITNKRLEQYPSTSSTSLSTIGQLRKQSQSAPGVYIPAVNLDPAVNPSKSCGITAPSDPNAVVFIEKVGNGDQSCILNVATSVQYKALVIGSGRIIIRGSGSIAPYTTTSANRFTGVVYALNLQTADQTLSTPSRQLVTVDKGARIRGAVHADGKNAEIALIPPEFSTTALVDALIPCTDLATCTLRVTLKALGVNELLDQLTNGSCLLNVVLVGCVVPGPSLGSVVGNITSQLSGYGSAIHSDVGIADALKVYGASGVVSGTFRDLQAR